MTLIAVSSTDGVNINAHFRRAEWFDIYEVDTKDDRATIVRVEKRQVNTDSLESIINDIADCDAVLVERMGQYAADLLSKNEIVPVAISMPVQEALLAYAQHGSLLSGSMGQCNCQE